MPLFFFIIGFVLIMAGYHGNAAAVGEQFSSDVQGFMAFGIAILILGLAGTIDSVRPISKALIFLVFVVFFLKNGSGISSNLSSVATGNAS